MSHYSCYHNLVIKFSFSFLLLFYSFHNCRREYHAITRGFVLQEVFRRIEPKQRSIGQFLREEVFQPLDVDVFIGIDEEKQKEMSIEDVKTLSDKEVGSKDNSTFDKHLHGR